jgi:acyl-coenzyme A synthetase/AMP-(fatty) acid ligase
MLQKKSTYDEVYRSFHWQIPEYYNIGVDVCDKWADERYRLALIYEDEGGRTEKYTFWDIKNLSNRLANTLRAHGIARGDRVGILLPQCPETAIAHVAIYKLGAIAIPLFTLFGPDALEYRLGNSGAKAVITDGANVEKVLQIRDRLPDLKLLFVTKGKPEAGAIDFWAALEKGASRFEPVPTKADDPALIIYTSGTTGPPKGALHAHRVVLGHVPGAEFFHNFFPKKEDVYFGEIAILRPDLVMFLNYWQNPQATRDKFVRDWSLTGDLGNKDEDGYIWYVARKDDVITSSGYRIGPAEIEDCLLKHPAVTMSAVIGKPDKVRTEVVKAFVVLKAGVSGSEELAREIQEFVKTRLAAHEYPREIEFVAELPMTSTGKIIRGELRKEEIRRMEGATPCSRRGKQKRQRGVP